MKRILNVCVVVVVASVAFIMPPSAQPWADAGVAAIVSSPFHYQFSVPGSVQEASNALESWSPYWWVNSGGRLYLQNGVGRTIHGELPANDKWRLAYSSANPLDTDNGYHPQNLFRLVSRNKWKNVRAEAFFKVNKIVMSASSNRNQSNGFLLMSRYVDGQSLYYAGLRVDGAVVIKKKVNGTYTTLGYKKILGGSTVYDRNTNANVIPLNQWIGLRSETITEANGNVRVKLFTDVGRTGNWTEALNVVDTGVGGIPIRADGYTGIRTDFMDAEFDDFRLTEFN